MGRVWIIAVLGLVGCASNGDLTIVVRTDRTPLTEFAQIRAELRRGDELIETATVEPVATLDYRTGQTVVSYPELATGTYVVRGALLDAGGAVIIEREVVVRVERATVVTVELDTGCVGCADAGEPPSDAAAGDAGPPELTLEGFCTQLAALQCDAVGPCCTTLTLDAPTRDECAMNARAACEIGYGNAANDPRITFDPALAEAGLAQATALTGMCSTEINEWRISRRGYWGGLVGSLPSNADCAPADPGDFFALLNAVLACGAPDEVCRAVSSTEWRCRPRGVTGEPCDYAMACESLRCERDSVLEDGVCGPGEAEGSACMQPDECASLVCSGDAGSRGCGMSTADAAYCIEL